MSSKSPRHGFPYAERAAAVEAARHAMHASLAGRRRDQPDHPGTKAWLRAIEVFRQALARAYPPGFDDAVLALKRGDSAYLDLAIEYLEADPFFYRSGYVREELLTYVKRLPRSREQDERLRAVLLMVVDKRDRRDFRRFCALERWLDNAALRGELERRRVEGSPAVRRRAGWMLAAMNQRM